MTHHRLPRISRALLSLSLTVGLVAGVPAVLIVGAGWPLPTNIPSIDALADGARSGIADEVIVNTLAVIAWLAWAQLTLAVVVEIIAAARGRPTTRLPVLPGFQATAARLIGGILMIASAFQPARAHAATPSLVLTPPVVTVAPTTAPPPVPSTAPDTNSSTGTRTGPQAPPASALPTVTVQRHDSYWAIAERTLGDGLRWREILDLNVGRVQPDGAVVAPNDDTLRPGWLLALPPDATVGPTTADHRSSGSVDPTVPSPPVVSETIAVEPGDNLWTIAEHRLATDLGRSPTDTEILPYWQQLIEQNRGRYVEPGNPDLILPGQILTLPPTGFEPAAVPPPSPVDDRTAPPPDRSPVETAAPDTPTSTFAPLPETGEATTDDSEPTPPTEPASEQPPDPQAPHPRSDDRPASAPAVVALGGLSSIALASASSGSCTDAVAASPTTTPDRSQTPPRPTTRPSIRRSSPRLTRTASKTCRASSAGLPPPSSHDPQPVGLDSSDTATTPLKC
ncbi:MAG: LysM peptidoglycan-binding domain-containing protein [Actinomyces sp.]|nr:MAG: LysM peptidoglycan-binding domain-containing protein [Actinomyces sp.]